MNQIQFIQSLEENGFPEPTIVSREAGGFLDQHAHGFEAKAFVLSGQITLQVDGTASLYREGEIFHLPAGQMHAELYGPQGVQYLVGRKE
jgi:quercetin dioxygenase-like cupin family protein